MDLSTSALFGRLFDKKSFHSFPSGDKSRATKTEYHTIKHDSAVDLPPDAKVNIWAGRHLSPARHVRTCHEVGPLTPRTCRVDRDNL